jgi:hypothetical protein
VNPMGCESGGVGMFCLSAITGWLATSFALRPTNSHFHSVHLLMCLCSSSSVVISNLSEFCHQQMLFSYLSSIFESLQGLKLILWCRSHLPSFAVDQGKCGYLPKFPNTVCLFWFSPGAVPPNLGSFLSV